MPGLGRLSPPAWAPDPEFDSTSTSATSTCRRRAPSASCSIWPPSSTRTPRPHPTAVALRRDRRPRGRARRAVGRSAPLHQRRHRSAAPGRAVHAVDPRRSTAARGRSRRRRGERRRRPIRPRSRAATWPRGFGNTATQDARPSRPPPAGHRPAGRRRGDDLAGRSADGRGDQLGKLASIATSTVGALSGSGNDVPGGSPLWKQRSRHRHLEWVSVSLDDSEGRGQGSRRLDQRLVPRRADRGARPATTPSAASRSTP